MEQQNIKVMARNREAYHEYFVEEEMEAGIELCGTEVKSIRKELGVSQPAFAKCLGVSKKQLKNGNPGMISHPDQHPGC